MNAGQRREPVTLWREIMIDEVTADFKFLWTPMVTSLSRGLAPPGTCAGGRRARAGGWAQARGCRQGLLGALAAPPAAGAGTARLCRHLPAPCRRRRYQGAPAGGTIASAGR